MKTPELPATVRDETGLFRVFISSQSLQVCRTTDGQINIHCSESENRAFHFIVPPADARYLAEAIIMAAGSAETSRGES